MGSVEGLSWRYKFPFSWFSNSINNNELTVLQTHQRLFDIFHIQPEKLAEFWLNPIIKAPPCLTPERLLENSYEYFNLFFLFYFQGHIIFLRSFVKWDWDFVELLNMNSQHIVSFLKKYFEAIFFFGLEDGEPVTKGVEIFHTFRNNFDEGLMLECASNLKQIGIQINTMNGEYVSYNNRRGSLHRHRITNAFFTTFF